MAATKQVVHIPMVDWTRGSPARLLSSISQVCQHAMRHFRRAAFRGGKGKLVAAKELNNGTAAGSAANQQWRGNRALTGLAKPEQPPPKPQLPAAPPPFAALPFLSSQELLAAVGRELQLPVGDALLRPLLALESPSFAATPVLQAAEPPQPDTRGSAGSETPRRNKPQHGAAAVDPKWRLAKLGSPSSPRSTRSTHSASQLRAVLHSWARTFAPAAPPLPQESRRDANARLKGALLRYASLGA